MNWWWDNLVAPEGDRYYPMYGSVARFVDGVRFDAEHLAPATLPATSPTRPLVGYANLGPDRLMLWVKDSAFGWQSPARVTTTAQVQLPATDRRWCGRWYDTWSGQWLSRFRAASGSTISSPPFAADIALLASSCA
jgi:hypothetical protein